MKKSLIVLIFYPILTWGNGFSQNDLLIQFLKDTNISESLKSIGAKSFEFLEDEEDGPIVARFDDSMDIESRLKKLLKNPLIKMAQLNFKYVIQGELLPNDPLLKNQWEHQNLGMQKVWHETTNCQQKIVAILDTGINFSHADLKESEFPKSYNAISPNLNPVDYNGHGTLMASIIGAKGDNLKGLSGICWATKIMSIKVLNDLGEGHSSDVIKGINFALKNNASILNLSFGSYFGEDIFLKKSLEKFLSKGTMAIVPAGNKGLNIEKVKFWPCSFKIKGMLCVASTTKEGGLADFSNFSEKDVDLAAPGDEIYGIAPGAFKENPDDFKDWIISNHSNVLETGNCIVDGKKVLMIPRDYCAPDENENEVSWAKKDFRYLVSNFDFSYVQFSAKILGHGKFFINDELLVDISNDQLEYFFDLGACQEKKECVLEFKPDNIKSKLAIWDFKIWGLKLGNRNYQRKFGSSLSAAYVSALAALIGTFNPNYSVDQIINSIKEGSKQSKNLKGKIAGSRLVDPFGQLKFLSKPKWH